MQTTKEKFLNGRDTLFENLFSKLLTQINQETFFKFCDKLLELVSEIDLTNYQTETVFNTETYTYETKVIKTYAYACNSIAHAGKLIVKTDEFEQAVYTSLCELREFDLRLMYEVIRTVFNVSQTKLLLFEFYDLALLYSTFQTNKYNRAYILSRPYFTEIDEQIELYFNASLEDVKLAYLKLDNSVNYTDEVLLQKINLALSQGNYPNAFVHLAKALCIQRQIFAVKKGKEIRFERRLLLWKMKNRQLLNK